MDPTAAYSDKYPDTARNLCEAVDDCLAMKMTESPTHLPSLR